MILLEVDNYYMTMIDIGLRTIISDVFPFMLLQAIMNWVFLYYTLLLGYFCMWDSLLWNKMCQILSLHFLSVSVLVSRASPSFYCHLFFPEINLTWYFLQPDSFKKKNWCCHFWKLRGGMASDFLYLLVPWTFTV